MQLLLRRSHGRLRLHGRNCWGSCDNMITASILAAAVMSILVGDGGL